MPDNPNTTADGGTNSGDAANKPDPGDTNQGDALTFDSLYERLPEEQRSVLDAHVSGLKNAFERKKEEAKELKAAMQALKDGREQDIEKVRTELGEQLATYERRVKFFETCPPEIANQKAALAVAREFGAMADDGTVNAEKLREVAPELFQQQKAIPNNARKTTGENPAPPTFNMTKWAAGMPQT